MSHHITYILYSWKKSVIFRFTFNQCGNVKCHKTQLMHHIVYVHEKMSNFPVKWSCHNPSWTPHRCYISNAFSEKPQSCSAPPPLIGGPLGRRESQGRGEPQGRGGPQGGSEGRGSPRKGEVLMAQKGKVNLLHLKIEVEQWARTGTFLLLLMSSFGDIKEIPYSSDEIFLF